MKDETDHSHHQPSPLLCYDSLEIALREQSYDMN